MSQISCPQCHSHTPRAGFGCLKIAIAILFFPIGLLILLTGRKPTACRNCNYRFIT